MEFINKVELQGVVGTVKEFEESIIFSLLIQRVITCGQNTVIESNWIQVNALKSKVQGDIVIGNFVHVTGSICTKKYVDQNQNYATNVYIQANDVTS